MAQPVVASLLGADESGQAILRSARIPVPSFTYPERRCGRSPTPFAMGQWRARPSGTVPVLADVDVNEARRRRLTTKSASWAGLPPLGYRGAAMDVLAAFGIPVSRTVEAAQRRRGRNGPTR